MLIRPLAETPTARWRILPPRISIQRQDEEVAGVGAPAELRAVEPAVRPLERRRQTVGREAAFGTDSVGDLLDRVIGSRLIRNAAMPCRTGSLLAVAAQGPRLRDILLHVKPRVIF